MPFSESFILLYLATIIFHACRTLRSANYTVSSNHRSALRSYYARPPDYPVVAHDFEEVGPQMRENRFCDLGS